MNVIEPERTENLVRADSYAASNGFRYMDVDDGIYSYFVPMSDNSTHLYIRQNIQDGESIFIAPKYVLVFNVKSNSAGIVKADEMVEPIAFNVVAEIVE